jgi:two-component system NtrC family sensor kinase
MNRRASRVSAERARGTRRWPLVSSMLLAIAMVTGLAWWDEQREADAALRDLETEQTVVASSLAAGIRAHLTTIERDAELLAYAGPARRDERYVPAITRASAAPSTVVQDATRLRLTVPLPDGRAVDLGVSAGDLLDQGRPGQRAERSGDVTVFLSAPNETSLRTSDGRALASPPLRDALDRGADAVRLTRSEAAQLGLPSRTAMAGLARVDAGVLGRWGVAAVASAARERDREKRALGRLLLGVFVTSGLIFLFGGVALRKQRRELALARELAVAEAQRIGEEALAQAQRIATMGTFAMGIAHEVATPLGVIMGRAEQLLARVQEDERATRSAQAIVSQVDRIQQIVRRFLDMARGGPPSLERADPAGVARSAAASVQHRFVRANVSLTAEIPDNTPEVQCDRALLEQALVNLLLNACDACMPGDHVKIAVRAVADRVEFVVTDDGVGIAVEHAARATEPFFTTKSDGDGVGLGLAIATEIAKSHRGELTIAPNAKRGTRACIEIPIAALGGDHGSLE